jgi:YggT family protein
MIAYTIHLIFLSYTILLFVRIVGSWFPKIANHAFMRFVSHYTDPYLNLFRRFIPPIGGSLDLSPLLGFFVLQLLEKFLLSIVL